MARLALKDKKEIADWVKYYLSLGNTREEAVKKAIKQLGVDPMILEQAIAEFNVLSFKWDGAAQVQQKKKRGGT